MILLRCGTYNNTSNVNYYRRINITKYYMIIEKNRIYIGKIKIEVHYPGSLVKTSNNNMYPLVVSYKMSHFDYKTRKYKTKSVNNKML